MGDCTVGKELKQSTCRYVKKCKPGWVRNDKYICRKTLRRTGKRSNNNSPNILTGNVGKQVLKSNSPNENRFGVLRGILGSPTKKSDPIKNIFGTPSPSPNVPKLTNKEKDNLFESPNEIFNNEQSNSPKVFKKTKKPKKLITGKVRPLLLKPKSRKNFRAFNNNLKNSPNEPFDLNTQKQLAYARLRKTKDLKLRERIKQKQREGMTRHARKIAKKYNVVQNSI
jgi:hypothetical protein